MSSFDTTFTVRMTSRGDHLFLAHNLRKIADDIERGAVEFESGGLRLNRDFAHADVKIESDLVLKRNFI